MRTYCGDNGPGRARRRYEPAGTLVNSNQPAMFVTACRDETGVLLPDDVGTHERLTDARKMGFRVSAAMMRPRIVPVLAAALWFVPSRGGSFCAVGCAASSSASRSSSSGLGCMADR